VHEGFAADPPDTMTDPVGVGAMEVPVMESHSHLNVLALEAGVEASMHRVGRSFESELGTNKP
jgi:hypothetical protein